MRRLAVWVALAVLISPAAAKAAGIGISSHGLWEGEALGISCWFDSPQQASSVRAEITEPISVQLSGFSGNGTRFAMDYVPPVIGQYLISCGNGSWASGQEPFSVSRLDAVISRYPGMAFTDQGIEIESNVVLDRGFREPVTSGVAFTVTLDGTELGLSGFPYYYSGHWVIRTQGLGDAGQGSHLLGLRADYMGASDSDQVLLDVSGPLVFRIESVHPDDFHGGEEAAVSIVAEYHNTSILSSSELSASLDGEALAITRTPEGFAFTMPSLDPKPHELEAVIRYGDFSATDRAPVYYMVPVRAEIRNAGNGGIRATIRFLGEGWQTSVNTNVNGVFTTSVPAGTYTLEMDFPDSVRAVAEGVGITEEMRDFVRFDSFGAGEIDGIRSAKSFALEFSEDFDSMTISAEYDGRAVPNEAEIEVYRCDNWDFDTRKCLGSWKETDFTIDEMKNQVEFTVDSLSGFVVGKRGELTMDFTIDRGEYIAGQTIKISGVVEDEDNRPVGGAEVTYTIDGGKDGEVVTSSSGIFSAEVPAPSRGGDYEIELRASKGFYRKDAKSMEFRVLSVRDFTIIPPGKVEAREGSEVTAEASVANTGQDDLEDFSISLSGIPEGWCEISPAKWGELIQGQEKKVLITIRPGPPLESVYTVSIDVEGGGISRSEGFVMYVEPLEKETQADLVGSKAGSAPPEPSPNVFDSVTVYLTGSTEAMVNTVSLLLSGGILLLIFRRVRAGGAARNRGWLAAALEGLRNEALGLGSSLSPRKRPMRIPSRRAPAGRPAKRARKAARKNVRRNQEGHLEIEV